MLAQNRNNDASSTPDYLIFTDIGVDLNRNFDFVWVHGTAFILDVDVFSVASDSPRSEIYHGSAAASEPETKAVYWAPVPYDSSLSFFVKASFSMLSFSRALE